MPFIFFRLYLYLLGVTVLSVLTKILIVLVCLLATFFCGVTLVYVGTAENFKATAADLKSENAALESDKAALETLYESLSVATKASLQKSNRNNEQLVRANSDLEVDLRSEQRLHLEKQRRLEGLMSEFSSLRVTIENMTNSLENTQLALEEARSTSVVDRKRLAELTDSLHERIVQIQSMEVKTKRLLEEKSDLEESFQTSLTPVTPEFGRALPATSLPMPSSKGLKGLILEVKGGLATVSIGAADGLNKNDVLHVYRGGDFVCDIVITDIDTNKAAGVLELVQQGGPRIGDTVTSEL
jgi:hypothetical protein